MSLGSLVWCHYVWHQFPTVVPAKAKANIAHSFISGRCRWSTLSHELSEFSRPIWAPSLDWNDFQSCLYFTQFCQILCDFLLNFFNHVFPLWGARRSTRIFVQHILIYFVSSAQCIKRKICLLCLFDPHSALISDLG